MTDKTAQVKSAAFAADAIKSMKELGVSPNPANFTVWYHYHSERVPGLRLYLDEALANKWAFDDAKCLDIFERFFTFGNEGAFLQETVNSIHVELSKFRDAIGDAGQGANEYGKELKHVSSQLDAAATLETVQNLVDRIITATDTMQQRNASLELEMRMSSGEISKLRSDLENMRREAFTDALTGIANRKNFDISIRASIREAEERGGALNLMLLDVDHFKKFNDLHGHQTGDKVLKLVAATVEECIGDEELAARYGGEEFAVIMPAASFDKAVEVADQIRERLASKRIVNRATGDDLGKITLSGGVSRFRKGETVNSFIQRADDALYRAKGSGRNRILAEQKQPDDE